MSLVIKMHDVNKIEYRSDNAAQNKGSGKNYRIFAGDLNIQESSVDKKRKEAQQKALKIVQDTWKSDREVDEMIQKIRDDSSALKNKITESKEYIKDLEEKKTDLKEMYCIDEDSQEQKDLELLEKRQDFENGNASQLTLDELEQLKEIDAKPLTEYQKRSLDLNKQMNKFKSDLRDAQNQMMDDYANIRSIKQERLKKNPMVEAQKTADSIMEAASKEIIGMLVDEAKESIDEKMEEEKEKADKKAEEKEKEEELEEYREEKRAIQEAIMEGTREAVEEAEEKQRRNDAPEVDTDKMLDIAMSYNSSTDDVHKELEELKNSMAILDADLKGVQVDTEI